MADNRMPTTPTMIAVRRPFCEGGRQSTAYLDTVAFSIVEKAVFGRGVDARYLSHQTLRNRKPESSSFLQDACLLPVDSVL